MIIIIISQEIADKITYLNPDIHLCDNIGMPKVRMVKGPAAVTVRGSCHLLGSDISDRTISVRAGKILPFELFGRCKLYVKLDQGGRTWMADPSTAGTAMWRGIVRKIFALAKDRKTTTVMLVGDTDTGKSTLSTFLVNRALAFGMMPCVIDGDIGQGDLAPPSAIGAATPSKQIIDLRDIAAGLFEFVGDKSPAGIEQLVTAKLKSILERSIQMGNNIVIINTDGYVRDGGASYKAHMAEVLQPDVIVCLGTRLPLFDTLKKSFGPWRVLHAPASSHAYKSRLDRIGRRLDQFLRYIGDGETTIKMEQLEFVYMGKTFFAQDLLRSPAAITIPLLEPSNMEGMFVGLGFENEIIGFGMIASMIDDHNLCIKTVVQNFDRVYLSNIWLDKDKTTEIKLFEMQGPEDQAK